MPLTPPFGKDATIISDNNLPDGLYCGLVGVVMPKSDWTKAALDAWSAKGNECLVRFYARGDYMLPASKLRFSPHEFRRSIALRK